MLVQGLRRCVAYPGAYGLDVADAEQMVGLVLGNEGHQVREHAEHLVAIAPKRATDGIPVKRQRRERRDRVGAQLAVSAAMQNRVPTESVTERDTQ